MKVSVARLPWILVGIAAALEGVTVAILPFVSSMPADGPVSKPPESGLLLGYLGMPRRYHAYPPEFAFWNVLSSAGAVILAAGYLLPLGYLTWSLFRGERAGANPWAASGLEWQTPSPPPPHNFEETPEATGPVYDYPPPEGER